MASRWQTLVRTLAGLLGCAALVAAGLGPAPAAAAQTCGPGFKKNPYTAECLAPVNTPTINGIPCIASKIGLCSSFVQNQQPRRVPRTSIG